ncbi:hypothetical protein ACWDTI_15700 [Gordonia sp. NPDC003424]
MTTDTRTDIEIQNHIVNVIRERVDDGEFIPHREGWTYEDDDEATPHARHYHRG